MRRDTEKLLAILALMLTKAIEIIWAMEATEKDYQELNMNISTDSSKRNNILQWPAILLTNLEQTLRRCPWLLCIWKDAAFVLTSGNYEDPTLDVLAETGTK